MKEVLIAMHKIGGQVTRQDIRNEIRDSSDVFSEDEVDKNRVSRKTGKQYHPFYYSMNFAVKYLILTGFINTEDNRVLELTEKDVRPFLEDNNSQELKEKSLAEVDSAKDMNDEDTDEDQWRQDLLDALMKMNPKKFEFFLPGPINQDGN